MVLKEMSKDVVWFFKIVGALVAGAWNSVAMPGHYIVQKQEREQVQALRNKTHELGKQVGMHPELKRQKYSCSHPSITIRRLNG